MRSSISQYGITWKFGQPVIAGQFVTGDWWVKGPATVVSVTPEPGKAGPDEKFNPKVDNFGETGLKDDKRMRNGSQINPVHSSKQGYDSRCPGYDPKLTVSFSLALQPGQSLISTVSHDSIPNKAFVKRHFHKSNSVLKSAAVLTCLAEQPPANSFRPPYAGEQKPLHCGCKLKKREKLLSLAPVEKVPSYKLYARYFKRPWLDTQADWVGLNVNPTENLPDYGREYARLVGMASLMLLLKNKPEDQAYKDSILTGLVQVGIDNYGLIQAGASWVSGGGIHSGRKWPILFAGIMLGIKEMRELPADKLLFSEDCQTYYGKGFFGDTALFQMVRHHGRRTPYEEKDPKTWKKWDRTSEGYRNCCTSNAWTGQALAALLLRAKKVWNHDAYFDYCDRWMKSKNSRKDILDPFTMNMWEKYRDQVPDQPGGKDNLMWVYDTKAKKEKMVANPRPRNE